MATKEINLTPNYDNMRNQFEREATAGANRISRYMRSNAKIPQDDVRNLIVSLNIALQAVHTAGALEEYRTTFSTLTAAIAKANDHFNNNAEEVEDGVDRADRYYSERNGG